LRHIYVKAVILGKYHVKGPTIEFNVYVHDDKVYLIEVESPAEIDHVEWFYKSAEIYGKITEKTT
jgi:hypothetical protein